MALLESCQCPWVCLGDFNFTVNDNEVLGKNRGGAGSSTTNYLKELIFESRAIDLGYSGNAFTWARGRWEVQLSREGLIGLLLASHGG